MIRSERHADIAVLTLDNPPVNATSQAVRQGLLDALSAAASDPGVAAIILIGANGRFSAGGDLRELGNTALNQPSLSDTIALIEAAAVPVIAALDGIALGGGLELALACHYRIGCANLKVGLPEVTLGVIPGAGGTQRLPRLIGPAAALEIITSGRHVDAGEALRLGILDELTDGDLLEAATALARRVLLAGILPQALSARTDRIANVDAGLFAAFRSEHSQAWRDALAPWKIVQAIEHACTSSREVGMLYEREAYVDCQRSSQRAALGHLFTARRLAKKTGLDQHRISVANQLLLELQRAVAMQVARGYSPEEIAGALLAEAWNISKLQVLPMPDSGSPNQHIFGSVIRHVANAALRILGEGQATRSDIDLISVEDMGFSEYRGGILFSLGERHSGE